MCFESFLRVNYAYDFVFPKAWSRSLYNVPFVRYVSGHPCIRFRIPESLNPISLPTDNVPFVRSVFGACMKDLMLLFRLDRIRNFQEVQCKTHHRSETRKRWLRRLVGVIIFDALLQPLLFRPRSYPSCHSFSSSHKEGCHQKEFHILGAAKDDDVLRKRRFCRLRGRGLSATPTIFGACRKKEDTYSFGSRTRTATSCMALAFIYFGLTIK